MIRSWLFLALAALLVACGGDDEATGSQTTAEAHDHGDETQLYTCGMHPNVVQEGPGSCPICGMDLTPMKESTAGGGSAEPAKADGEREISHWVAPMDPTYIRDEPGKSPMGMDLVPVYEDEMAAGPSVTISPVVAQNMGLRTEVVDTQPLFRHLRTVGEVEVGEDQIAVVNLRFSGWVERIHVDKTGDEVDRGDRLFEIYSPELVAAQEEYLLALRNEGPDSRLARSARKKLELWNLPDYDIERIAERGETLRTMPIRAPTSGFVLHKDIVEGASVKEGEDLYRIGNLEKIWVTAEVYEFDAPWVEVGQPAQMELAFQQGKVIEGEVAYIYPTLNEDSRTLTVRLEFENPGIRLKPGMFATVYIQYRRKEDVLAVPSEAILRSGLKELVFVDRGGGQLEPREVITGLVGDRHLTEVVSGLQEGERVVVSGQFLIDSESNLQEAVAKLLAQRTGEAQAASETPTMVWSCPMHPEVLSDEPGRCPECGMDLEKRRGTPEEIEQVYGASAEHAGMDHGDHADHDHAAARPGQYTCPMHPEVVSDEPGRCPDCGMFLEQVPEEAHYACPMHPTEVARAPGDCSQCGMPLEEVEGPIYACPMHPDEMSTEPGDCSQCGMPLEQQGADE